MRNAARVALASAASQRINIPRACAAGLQYARMAAAHAAGGDFGGGC